MLAPGRRPVRESPLALADNRTGFRRDVGVRGSLMFARASRRSQDSAGRRSCPSCVGRDQPLTQFRDGEGRQAAPRKRRIGWLAGNGLQALVAWNLLLAAVDLGFGRAP